MKQPIFLTLCITFLLASTFAPYTNTASSNLKKNFLLNTGANGIGIFTGIGSLICLGITLFASDEYLWEEDQDISPEASRFFYSFGGVFFGTLSAVYFCFSWGLFKNAATSETENI